MFEKNQFTSVDRGDPNRINMRVLESKGYLHLYGLAPVLNALSAAKRNFSPDFSVDVAVAEKNRAEPRLFDPDPKCGGSKQLFYSNNVFANLHLTFSLDPISVGSQRFISKAFESEKKKG